MLSLQQRGCALTHQSKIPRCINKVHAITSVVLRRGRSVFSPPTSASSSLMLVSGLSREFVLLMSRALTGAATRCRGREGVLGVGLKRLVLTLGTTSRTDPE